MAGKMKDAPPGEAAEPVERKPAPRGTSAQSTLARHESALERIEDKLVLMAAKLDDIAIGMGLIAASEPPPAKRRRKKTRR